MLTEGGARAHWSLCAPSQGDVSRRVSGWENWRPSFPLVLAIAVRADLGARGNRACRDALVSPARLERATHSLEGCCSIHLSYGEKTTAGAREWSGREDSNLRPPGPKPGALPGCATPRHTRGFLQQAAGVGLFRSNSLVRPADPVDAQEASSSSARFRHSA